MRRTWLLIIGLLLVGCSGNDSPIARAAGSWSGQFAIESVDGKTDQASIDAEQTRGNLELYVTGQKFQLDMKDRHQGYTLVGTWKVAKDRITLSTDKYSFDAPNEDDQKALNLKLVSPDEIRTMFGHPVILDESPDKRRLVGLKSSLGRLGGRLEFSRPIPH